MTWSASRTTTAEQGSSPQGEPERHQRGHAYLAASARRALGVQVAVARVADVPAPVFCAVVAAAASVVAVLLRPQRVPRGVGIPLDAVLVAACAASIVVHARVAERHSGADERGGLEPALLPVAALCSLLVALAGSDGWGVTVPAAVTCAVVVALSAHVDALRAAEREGARERVLRDAAGSAVMIPIAVAGASTALAAPARVGVVLLVAGLVSAAAVVPMSWRRTAARGAAVGLVIGLTTLLAARAGTQAAGAAGLLLLWYGLRGVVASLPIARAQWLALLEYVAVTAGAAALLVTQARG
jgi:hypothetical protein